MRFVNIGWKMESQWLRFVRLVGGRVLVGLNLGTVIILRKEEKKMKRRVKMTNNTFCLSCGVISNGIVCNNCGDSNVVPAHDYREYGFKKCRECGAVFRYSVGKCSICQKGGE